jgi:hypothetical protein
LAVLFALAGALVPSRRFRQPIHLGDGR